MESNEFKSLKGKYAIIKNNWNWGATVKQGDIIVITNHTPMFFYYKTIKSSIPNYPYKDVEWSGSTNAVKLLENLSNLEKLIYDIPD